jgi:hypothetical protein
MKTQRSPGAMQLARGRSAIEEPTCPSLSHALRAVPASRWTSTSPASGTPALPARTACEAACTVATCPCTYPNPAPAWTRGRAYSAGRSTGRSAGSSASSVRVDARTDPGARPPLSEHARTAPGRSVRTRGPALCSVRSVATTLPTDFSRSSAHGPARWPSPGTSAARSQSGTSGPASCARSLWTACSGTQIHGSGRWTTSSRYPGADRATSRTCDSRTCDAISCGATAADLIHPVRHDRASLHGAVRSLACADKGRLTPR